MNDLVDLLDTVASSWKIVKRADTLIEVEAHFLGDDGWSRCGPCETYQGVYDEIRRFVVPSSLALRSRR